MTNLLCHQYSYLRAFDATVTESTPTGIIPDRTAFYPGGDGQPGDAGVLETAGASYRVTKLTRVNGKVIQEVSAPGPTAGERVHGVID